MAESVHKKGEAEKRVHGRYGCVNLVSIEDQVVKRRMQREHPLGKLNGVSTGFCPKLRIHFVMMFILLGAKAPQKAEVLHDKVLGWSTLSGVGLFSSLAFGPQTGETCV